MLIIASVLGTPGCSRESLPTARSEASEQPVSEAPFQDITLESGLDFEHDNGMSGEFYMCEMVGVGAALFDFDNDGDLDVYIPQGHLLVPSSTSANDSPPDDGRHRLFRNDLAVKQNGSRELRFTDVTAASGIDETGYGMGAVASDFDNDGWCDLYVTNFGVNRHYRNNGDGTFAEVDSPAASDPGLWSTSAAVLDYDGDGWMDLFVCEYVRMTLHNSRKCFTRGGARDYCGPQVYNPEPDRLLRNRGDGTFEDVSAPSRISKTPGPALGVVCCDLNRDGRTDVYVANDGAANHYWVNRPDGQLVNEAILSGCAFSRNGAPEASMGVDAADFDGDGDDDLFMTHLQNEKNTLYVNDGSGLFLDETDLHGLDSPSRAATAFGTLWFDYDNDGLLDLFAANGAVRMNDELFSAGDTYPFGQRNQLFRNVGGGQFVDASAGESFEIAEVSRGAAFGDLDNDGDTDVIVLNNNGRARVLLNVVGDRQSWLGVRVVESPGQFDAIGARVALHREGQPPLWRRVRTDGSFCSSSDPRVLFGLGTGDTAVNVKVVWPDGEHEEWKDVPARQYVELARGTGERSTQVAGRVRSRSQPMASGFTPRRVSSKGTPPRTLSSAIQAR
ncbi:CRTAC1 family protein [Maioricimonas rarisocia]|nr:CRTAC1 family protein [Maioricimonas rarisocia]